MKSEVFQAMNPNPDSERCRAPRLFIREMVMRNFKSYAGEQRVGPFHKSFSAVVGPNGSGKSNVIDAMLFVFGKRAKQMRLNKVSELIHNSTNHQNLDSAGVSVHFEEIVDLEDGLHESVPGSDFVITRVAFRDNSSKYYINSRSSNFTEVTKKLKGKGIDLDNNRFLILQGEVEQISLMKPKSQGAHDDGFLEYLEDIIGTNKYVEMIDESSKMLESLNEKRSGVVQMVKLAEKERDSLEDVKNEAEAYMLRELCHLKWQEKASHLALEDTNASIAEVQENISNLEENIKVQREKIKEDNTKLKDIEILHNKYTERQEELDSELRMCKDGFKEFERQDVKYQEDLKHIKQKLKKLDDKAEKDSLKIKDLSKECQASQKLIPKLENDIPRLQKISSEEEAALEEIEDNSKAESETYRIELAKVRTELDPWERQIIEHKGKQEVACTERKLLEDTQNAGYRAYEEAQKQMKQINEKIQVQRSSILDNQNDLEKNKKEGIKARDFEKELLKEQESLISIEQTARGKLSELLHDMESEKSQGVVLKEILEAKETNHIAGIYGRLGDLGAIDAKYDIAISTACSALDYILVETTSAAQACVELLRKKHLGVATFMILEKQVNYMNKLKGKVSTPEGVPRLYDLVKVDDERLRLAFFAALGSTVVAKDINQAVRIAYGRNPEFKRVVTLEGALFEKNGTMSGGGGKPRGGKMGTSIRTCVSPETVAIAQRELSAIVEKVGKIRQQIADTVAQYITSEKAVGHLQIELAKSQKEIESLNTQHSYLENQLHSLKAASQPKKEDLKRLEELKSIILEEENEITRLNNGSKKLKEKSSILQSKIENAGGERLKSQRSKVKKIQCDIDKCFTDINHHKVLVETGQKLINKLTNGIEESKKENERLLGDMEKLISSFKLIEQNAFKVQESYKDTLELMNRHKEVLDQSKHDYNKLKKTTEDLQAAEVDVDYKLKDMKKSYRDLEFRGKGFKKKLDELSVKIVNHVGQIERDLVDSEKVKRTLEDETFNDSCDTQRALEMVTLLSAQLKEMNPNLESIKEYRQKVASYKERMEELNMVSQERDDIKKQYDDWRKKRLDEFMEGFNSISLKLKEMYQMITLGGDAELELVDSLDPFAEGVVFSVRPPKKSWKNIANLSGGEKTLSSLALVFALHHYKPTPLYVMDEIDAALDFKNVSIVGHYVKDQTKDAQFIIISLRNNMFELADRLVGIYKTDNCTKSITINPASFAVSNKVAS